MQKAVVMVLCNIGVNLMDASRVTSTYVHEWNNLNDKEKRCWKCSSLEHIAKDCTAGDKVMTSPGDRSSEGSPKGKGKTKDGKNDKGKGKDRDKPVGGVDQSSKDSQPQVAQIQQQPQVAQIQQQLLTQQQPQVVRYNSSLKLLKYNNKLSPQSCQSSEDNANNVNDSKGVGGAECAIGLRGHAYP